MAEISLLQLQTFLNSHIHFHHLQFYTYFDTVIYEET